MNESKENLNISQFESELIKLGINPSEAKDKTQFFELLKKRPETDEEWDELIDAWESGFENKSNVDMMTILELFWLDKIREAMN